MLNRLMIKIFIKLLMKFEILKALNQVKIFKKIMMNLNLMMKVTKTKIP